MNEQAAKAAIQAAIRSGDYAEAARLAGQLAEQIDRRAPASSTKAKAPASSSSSSTKAKAAPAAASSTKAKAPASSSSSSTKAKAAPAPAGTAVPRSQASAAERQAAQRAAQRAEAAVGAAERGAQRAAERAAALRAEAGQATGARRAQFEARAARWASRAREGKATVRLRGEVAAELRSRIPEAAPAARGPVKGTDYDRARATVRRARAAEERARAKGDAAGAQKAAARRAGAEKAAEQARARARSKGERLSSRGDRADKSRTGDRGRRSGELGGGVWRSGRKAGELLPAAQAVSGIFDKVKQSSIGETHGINSLTVKDAAGNSITVTARDGKKLTERQVAAAIRQAKKDGNLSGEYYEIEADSLVNDEGDVYTSAAA